MNKLSEKVYEYVKKIPRGKVSTYGDVSRTVGTHPRVVGKILHNNPYEGEVLCHRVVNSFGRLAPTFAFGGSEKQRELLLKEGVKFVGKLVDLTQSLWK